jgi:hypothetical protein
MTRSTTTRPAAPRPKPAVATPLPPKVQVGRKPVGPAASRWEGVGSHSNPSVYEPPKPGDLVLTAPQVARGEQQVANLHPQVTRVRVDPTILQLQDPAFATEHPADAAAAQKRLGELEHFVNLSLQHGGRADLCLWFLPKGYRTTPQELKTLTDRYAVLVKRLLAAHPDAKPGTFLVSAQNEPNRTKLAPAQVVSLFRDLDASLKTTLGPARTTVKLVAGELTEGDQSAKWINAVVPKLGGVVDAFSFHVYVRPGETAQAYEARLKGLRREVDAAMPRGLAAPELLVTEYGVRGDRPPGSKGDEPGTVTVGGKKVLLRDSPEGGFREAQALIALTHAGFSGAMRWGGNAGGPTPWDAWSMTGRPGEGFAKKPAYFATQLFTTAVGQGWIPEQPVGAVAQQSIAAYRAPAGGGAAAVVANARATAQRLRLAGFPPGAQVQVLVYNAGGSGQLISRLARSTAQGEVTVSVPPHGVTAATTRLEPPA